MRTWMSAMKPVARYWKWSITTTSSPTWQPGGWQPGAPMWLAWSSRQAFLSSLPIPTSPNCSREFPPSVTRAIILLCSGWQSRSTNGAWSQGSCTTGWWMAWWSPKFSSMIPLFNRWLTARCPSSWLEGTQPWMWITWTWIISRQVARQPCTSSGLGTGGLPPSQVHKTRWWDTIATRDTSRHSRIQGIPSSPNWL